MIVARETRSYKKYGSVSLELHSSFIIDIITRLFDLNDITDLIRSFLHRTDLFQRMDCLYRKKICHNLQQLNIII
jgi:hypothetical protein